MNGYSNARNLAKLYGIVANGGKTKEGVLLSQKAIETAPDQRGQLGQNHQPDAWLRCCGDDGRTGKEYNGAFYIYYMYETLC